MAEEKRLAELSQQEQEEVAKLFEDFASQGWSSSPEPEKEPPETLEDSESPAPAKKHLSKKALLGITIAGFACILAIFLYAMFRKSPLKIEMAPMTFSAGSHLVMAVTEAGTVLTPSAATSFWGSPVTTQTIDVLKWTDIVSISVGTLHTLGLKKDGTVASTGFYQPDNVVNPLFSYIDIDLGQTNVGNWENIVAVAAGYQHSVGLRSDGTVVAVGDNSFGQCEVEEWTDIIQISAGSNHTVGLKSDGTVVSTKIPSRQPDDGQCNVATWTDIVYISAGTYTTIGVRGDGTVVAAGANALGQCNVATWTDIISVAAGTYHTVGLKKDGTVVSTEIIQNPLSSYIADYDQSNVGSWADIVAVAVTNQQTFGLKKDGTVIYAGLQTLEVNEYKIWRDICVP